SRQADEVHHPLGAWRRLRHLFAPDWLSHRSSYSRQSDDRPPEHARRRRFAGGQLRWRDRAEGRHDPDDGQPSPGDGPITRLYACVQGRPEQVWLDRQSRRFKLVTYVWYTSPTRTMEDAKRRVTSLGGSGAGSVTTWLPLLYNNVLGTR